jgi:hypothetical protein
MAWGWISELLGGHRDGVGLFGYLAGRDCNRTRVKLEAACREATNDLIGHLPYGAVYRETTRNCQREIWMPSQPQPPVLPFPVVHHEPANDPFDGSGLPAALRAIGQPGAAEPKQGQSQGRPATCGPVGGQGDGRSLDRHQVRHVLNG